MRFKNNKLSAVMALITSGGFAAIPGESLAMQLEEYVTDQAGELEEVSVVGIMGSNKRALDKKRAADSIVDGIASEDLGKFPDQNVAESLQRITGISINRSGGEGRFLTVRGFGPEFNAVLYNGRVLATENAGREFSFDVLAAEVISGADAYKAGTADLVTGGIGATIDLSTAKPMDFDGVKTAFSVKDTYDTLAEDHFPQMSGVYSISNEDFGFLISTTYSERKYRVDNAGTGGWMERDLSYVPSQVGDADFSKLRVPRNMDFFSDIGTRERLGGTGVFQAKITDDIEMTVDLLYSKFVVDSSVMTSANWTHDWGEFFDSVTADKNNTLLAYSYDGEFDLASDFVQQEFSRPTETRQVGVNLAWDVTENFIVDFDASYSDAKNDNRGRGKFVIVGSPTANPRYDYTNGGEYPRISLDRGISAADLRSHQTWFSGGLNEDSIGQFSLDGEYHLPFGNFEKVSFGIYGSDRTKGGSDTGTTEGGIFAGYGYDLPDELFTAVNQGSFLDGGVPSTWFTFDPIEYAEYLWSTEHLDRVFADSPEERAEAELLKRSGNPFPRANRTSEHEVDEQVLEAFVKLDFNAEISDMALSGNLGVRYALTDVASTGFTSVLTDITQVESDPTLLDLRFTDPQTVTVKHDYSNVLPSLNLKLDVTDEHVARFSASKTMSRPTLTRLGVGLGGYVGRLGASTASGGNPELEPFESTNYDLSWSWYYSDASYVGAAAFVKKAENFLSQTTLPEDLLPGNPFGEFQVTRARNTASATVSGFEIAALHNFSNGFGLQANYTIVESDDDFDPITRPEEFALEGLSDSANFIAFYEANGIQLRAAYNWRDEYLARAIGRQSQAEMVEAYGQVDLSASYDVNDRLTIYAEGINVTDEKTRSFSIYKERLLDYSATGARFSLGLRANF